MGTKSSYFFWDYAISEAEVKKLLQTGTPAKKTLIISRLLEHAKWEDIWKFLTLREIKSALPSLKINPKLKKIWEYAVSRWDNG